MMPPLFTLKSAPEDTSVSRTPGLLMSPRNPNCRVIIHFCWHFRQRYLFFPCCFSPSSFLKTCRGFFGSPPSPLVLPSPPLRGWSARRSPPTPRDNLRIYSRSIVPFFFHSFVRSDDSLYFLSGTYPALMTSFCLGPAEFLSGCVAGFL